MASFAFQLGMESHSVTPFCLAWAFDELSRMRKDDKHSIVLVVSPLVSFSRVHTYPSVCELKKLEIAATFMPNIAILVEVDTEQTQ